jgi:hypothetical protein
LSTTELVFLLTICQSSLHDVEPLAARDNIETVERAEHNSMTSPRVMSLFAALALIINTGGIGLAVALAVRQRIANWSAQALGCESRLDRKHGAAAGPGAGIRQDRFGNRRRGRAHAPAVESLLPARRVASIDPLIALRLEQPARPVFTRPNERNSPSSIAPSAPPA